MNESPVHTVTTLLCNHATSIRGPMTTTRLTTALIALAALASGCYSSSTTYVASDSVSGPVSTGYVEYEVWYHDPHPVHVVDEHAGDWCFIEGAHSHYYEPEHLDFYVVDSG